MTESGIKDEKARLRLNLAVAEDRYLARLEARQIAAAAVPGQFVEVRLGDQIAPFLRLPLSLSGRNRAEGTVDLLYEALGPKSELMSRFEPGRELACLGPLGHGFWMPPPGQGAVLVGGGIGLPPLLFLAEALGRDGRDFVLLAGARTAAQHLPDALLGQAAPAALRATDDGTLGHAGVVTDLLRAELGRRSDCTVYACGPRAMMAATARLCADRGVACQVSLEEYMACGFGVCMGCAVEVLPPAEASPTSPYAQYSRVCADGPVFDASRVRW